MCKPQRTSPRSNEVSVELVGGLGNQLFGYFFGKYLDLTAGLIPTFFLTRTPEHLEDRGSIEASFVIDSQVSIRTHGALDFVTIRELLFRSLAKFGFSEGLASRFSRIHWSRGIGEDSEIEAIRPRQLMRGYFQSAKYFRYVKTHSVFGGLTLKNPSCWFDTTRKEIQSQRPIVIHIRRGDYSDPVNADLGQLKEEYFLSALYNLKSKEELINSPVWVFSDEIEEIPNLFPNLAKVINVYVDPPNDSDAAESLVLMSLAEALIISNSTFSWWAASLGPEKSVVAPSKWFKNLDDPVGLFAPEWQRAESQWS